MLSINSTQISKVFHYKEFVAFLKTSFRDSSIVVPQRSHFPISDKNVSLIMPAWNNEFYGIKQILISPDNPTIGLPTIRGDYNLYNSENGEHLASFDAPKLTALRTAATSVLASQIILNNPKSLLIIGAGVIAEELIKAYSSVFQLEQIKIWNRTSEKAQNLVDKYMITRPLSLCQNLENEVNDFDIISCATHAFDPIIKGKWIKGSHHFDLIGSYSKNMREVDNDVIKDADIFIDHQGAISESGDLSIPLDQKVINEEMIKGDLFEMCNHSFNFSPTKNLTVFKSVGHALEDLACAIYLYKKLSND